MAKIVGDYPGQVPGKEYQVKDSGKREEYASGMRRDTNEGKPRYALIVPETMKENMLKRWAVHMAKGAEKYGDRNWELATGEPEMKRFRESAFRHFVQWFQGETDEDHASAVFFNIQAFEYVKEKLTKPDVSAEEARLAIANSWWMK